MCCDSFSNQSETTIKVKIPLHLIIAQAEIKSLAVGMLDAIATTYTALHSTCTALYSTHSIVFNAQHSTYSIAIPSSFPSTRAHLQKPRKECPRTPTSETIGHPYCEKIVSARDASRAAARTIGHILESLVNGSSRTTNHGYPRA